MTVVFLTTADSSPWTVPGDCTSVQVECIGAGGSGGIRNDTFGRASGAGGGAYAKMNSLSVTPSSTINFGVGTGGAAVSGTDAAGNNGGDTWFNATSLANAVSNGNTISVGAQGGRAGNHGGGTDASGGAGGASGSSVGDTVFSGGAGGAANGGAGRSASGGGGAAGPNGAGVAGTASSNSQSAGGAGDNSSGGAGGTAGGGAGGNGTEYDASHGSGGGGGGRNSGNPAGSGGAYGGGGGGSETSSPTSGAGGAGLIIITYTPTSSSTVYPFNHALVGI